MLLFKRNTQTVDGRVAVHLKGAGAVGDGVPVGKDQNWWSGKLVVISGTIISMAGVDTNGAPFLSGEVIDRIR